MSGCNIQKYGYSPADSNVYSYVFPVLGSAVGPANPESNTCPAFVSPTLPEVTV